ncbi:MAG: hypothetical protein E2O39_14980, partial [Planctomycetota bacterium]
MTSRRSSCLAALLVLSACGGGGEAAAPPEVVQLVYTAGVDEEVAALISEHVALARARPTDPDLRANLAMAYEANELWS